MDERGVIKAMIISFVIIISGVWLYMASPPIASVLNTFANPHTSTGALLQFNASGLPAGAAWSGTASGISPSGSHNTVNWNITGAAYDTGPWTISQPPYAVNYTIYIVSYAGRYYQPSPSAGTDYTPSSTSLQYYQNITFKELPASDRDILTIEVAGIPAPKGNLFTFYNYTGYLTNNISINQSISTNRPITQYILPNGTYYFHFNPIVLSAKTTWNASAGTGYFSLYANNWTLFILYYNTTPGLRYNVSFNPVDLPTGARFTLILNSTEFVSSGNIKLNLSPGTYAISALLGGYTYNGSATVLVFENNEIVYIHFTKNTYIDPASHQFLNLLEYFNLNYAIFYSMIALLGGMIIAYILYRESENVIITAAGFQSPIWIAFIIGLVSLGIPLFMLLISLGILGINGKLSLAEEV